MRYQIRVAGKVFEGTDYRSLIKRAVEAKKQAVSEARSALPYSSMMASSSGAPAGV